MQQLSNILLGNSSKTADASSKDMIQGVENTSFLSAFHQANQSGLAKSPVANISPVVSSEVLSMVESDAIVDPLKDSTDLTNISNTENGADIDLIFAQLNMADSLSKSHPSDGNILPHTDQRDWSGNKRLDIPTELTESQDSSFIAEESLVDDLFADLIEVPDDSVTSKNFLTQLTAEERQELTAFSGLAPVELLELDNQNLTQLVNDFNLQQPVVDDSILELAAAGLEGLVNISPKRDYIDSNFSYIDQQDIIDINGDFEKKFNNETSKDIIFNDEPTITTINGDVELDDNTVIPDELDKTLLNQPHAISTSPLSRSTDNVISPSVSNLGSTASTLPTNSLNTNSILGGDIVNDINKQSIGTNIKTDGTVEASVLSKADFSVVLDTVVGKKVSSDAASVLMQIDNDISASEIDNKTFSNQSSFTPIHKSDVPQFQLSLRPQGEPGAQMQEMIQRFSPVMKQQLITMVSNGIQQAEIRLDPPELGHLTVKIQIQGDQTQVQFHVAQSQTRDIVEQAMPRLRDMLAQEGLQLTDSQVSQGDGGSEQPHEQSSNQGGGDSQLDEISAQEVSLMTNPSRSLHSAIDYYA
ncbi:flagellar hook-length control protein FliK [Shewanella sp. ALD9]|uniref:flagellar hook-length control protein FliK n=1 Tax=Shewanella sp. ALD9 TaxID=2058330 RepID=UPI001F5BF4B3|nr:flagellar hook-length control protein FliK [Shewanella sp. ALD9]